MKNNEIDLISACIVVLLIFLAQGVIGVILWKYVMVNVFGLPFLTLDKMLILQLLMRILIPTRTTMSKQEWDEMLK